MNQDDHKRVQELPPGACTEVKGYLSVITEELKEVEKQTGNSYGTLVIHRGTESFVRITNLTKKQSLRGQVEQILQKLTPDSPVEIPKGTIAAQYAYSHAKQMGLRYRITDGKVSIASAISLRSQVFQAMAELTEVNPVHIPAGAQAANYAYTYAASHMGRKCAVRNGTVTLVKEDDLPLRVSVFTALDALTEENTVEIPKCVLATQYAYSHAREHGLRYKITSGVVSLAPKREEINKLDLLKRLLNLEKGETITETVAQSYLRKVEDVSGYGFLLDDGVVTRLK